MEPWITTYSGRKFIITQATADDIFIEDIAHQLSNICRFAGAVKTFYSVAEHCCRLCLIVPPEAEAKLDALLHDAAEAYLTDLPSLIKRSLPKYMMMENKLRGLIYLKYGAVKNDSTKGYEDILTATEIRDLMNVRHNDWFPQVAPLTATIIPWSPQLAEVFYLRLFEEYYHAHHNY